MHAKLPSGWNHQASQNLGIVSLAAPLTDARAITGPPVFGRTAVLRGGEKSGSTRIAAYSVPRWVEFLQVESALISVNVRSVNGCTYQSPLRSFKNIFCPGRGPIA